MQPLTPCPLSSPLQVHTSGPVVLCPARGGAVPAGQWQGGVVWLSPEHQTLSVEDDAQHWWWGLVCDSIVCELFLAMLFNGHVGSYECFQYPEWGSRLVGFPYYIWQQYYPQVGLRHTHALNSSTSKPLNSSTLKLTTAPRSLIPRPSSPHPLSYNRG